jgi:hypothetical protein
MGSKVLEERAAAQARVCKLGRVSPQAKADVSQTSSVCQGHSAEWIASSEAVGSQQDVA